MNLSTSERGDATGGEVEAVRARQMPRASRHRASDGLGRPVEVADCPKWAECLGWGGPPRSSRSVSGPSARSFRVSQPSPGAVQVMGGVDRCCRH
jgi:hypothetical protein